MLKTQQNVYIKLSKTCQNRQKYVQTIKNLASDKKIPSRSGGEIIHKSSSCKDVTKCRRHFKLFFDLLDSLEQGPENQQLNINDTDVGSSKQCLGLLNQLLALLYGLKVLTSDHE